MLNVISNFHFTRTHAHTTQSKSIYIDRIMGFCSSDPPISKTKSIIYRLTHIALGEIERGERARIEF
jgi:hypothetical protein